MKTLLLLFVSAVAWGQTIESRAVMLKGTSLPGTCAIGERFFKTDATAGENLYLATNDSPCTWTQVVGSGGGSGASAVTDLTDCKVTTASATATMAACNFSYLGSDGRWTVAAMSSATWVISGGSDTGTARFEIDPNGGSPIWRCLYDGGMTATNYTPTNCTETSGSTFSVGAYPVASVAVSNGAWSTVTDFRALPQVANYTVDGDYILKSGNALSGNGVRIGERVAHSVMYGTGGSFAIQTTDDITTFWRNAYGTSIVINSVTCETDTGSANVQFQKNDGSATDMFSANLACATTPATTSTFVSGENTLATTNRLDFLVVSIASGTPTKIAITFNYTVQ